MKFVVNYYRTDFHIMKDQPPPVPNAHIENLAFGAPPFEIRETWVFNVEELSDLLTLVQKGEIKLTLEKTAYWNNASLNSPAERLLGVAVIDNEMREIDLRDRPIRIIPATS